MDPTFQEIGFPYTLGEGFLSTGTISFTDSALLCVHLTFLFGQLRKFTQITFSSGPWKTRKGSLLAVHWPPCPEFLILGGGGEQVSGDRFGWIKSLNLSSSLVKLPSVPLTCKAYFWPSFELNSEQLWTFCAVPLKLQKLPVEDNALCSSLVDLWDQNHCRRSVGFKATDFRDQSLCVQMPLLFRCVDKSVLTFFHFFAVNANGGWGRGCRPRLHNLNSCWRLSHSKLQWLNWRSMF